MKRVCLLTGAGGKLGTAFCKLLAEKYDIAAVYHQQPIAVPTQRQWFVDPLNPTVTPRENRHPVFAIQADLTDGKDLVKVVQLTLARFNRIDLLLNAAVYSFWGPMIDSDRLLDSVLPQFQVNVGVPLKLSGLIARHFWRGREQENTDMNRHILNMSSIAGLHIYPDLGQSVYSASKAALNYLTYHMADEFHSVGVRVNAVAPNTFPEIVPTETVVSAIARLDRGKQTGKILVLDADGESVI